MVSKKKLTAGIALVATAAYALTKWRGSAEPAVVDAENTGDVETVEG